MTKFYFLDTGLNKVIELRLIDGKPLKLPQGTNRKYTDEHNRTLILPDSQVFNEPITCMIVSMAQRLKWELNYIDSPLELYKFMSKRLLFTGIAKEQSLDSPMLRSGINKAVFRNKSGQSSPMGYFLPCLDNMGFAKDNYEWVFDQKYRSAWIEMFGWLDDDGSYARFVNIMVDLEDIHDNEPHAKWQTLLHSVEKGEYCPTRYHVKDDPEELVVTETGSGSEQDPNQIVVNDVCPIGSIAFVVDRELRTVTVVKIIRINIAIDDNDGPKVTYYCGGYGAKFWSKPDSVYRNASDAMAVFLEFATSGSWNVEDQ